MSRKGNWLYTKITVWHDWINSYDMPEQGRRRRGRKWHT